MSFLKEYLPAPIADFAPLLLTLLLLVFFLPRLMSKLKETGFWDRLVDTVGGEKYRVMQFEREIKRLVKRGDVVGAAQLYEEAEWFPEALNLYMEAEEYTAAGALYERLQEWGQAAELYVHAGDWRRAAKVLAESGNPTGAAELCAEYGQKIDAAKLYFDAGLYDRAARIFEEAEQYPQAAKSYEQMGEFIRAAENYEKHWVSTASLAGGGLIASPSARESKVAAKAGQLYEQAGELEKAAAIYERAGLIRQAADLAGRMGDFGRAAELLLKEEKLEEAAEMFQKAGEERRAALLRGEIAFHQGDHQTAAEELLRGGDALRAAELFESAEDLSSAAKCYEQADAPLQAANVFLRAGKKHEAAILFEKGHDFEMAAKLFGEVGKETKASELFEKAGRFYEAGRSAHDSGDNDRAIHLLQQVDPDSDHFESATLILTRLFLEKDMASLAAEKLIRMLGDRPVTSRTLEHYYYLGRAYEHMGKTREAAETYKKVMAERYDYQDVEIRLTRLTSPKPATPVTEVAAVAPPPPKGAPPGPPASSAAVSPAPPRPAPPASAASSPSPEIDAPPKPPSAQSPIRLAQALGNGLLGPTYKGIDTRSNRVLTVKFLRPELLQDQDVLGRFVAEARQARRLAHPNIVLLLGLVDIGGRKAVAMEYVEGSDLARIVARNKRLSVRQAVDLLAKLASALGYAHENGLVHNNLKMTNVLVAKGGRILLSGLGLGALRTARQGRADGYPSPELLDGGKPDVQNDIYALGAMLLHGLSGLHPGSTPAGSGGAPDSVRSRVPDIPEALDHIITRCLGQDPSSRFDRIADLAAAARVLQP